MLDSQKIYEDWIRFFNTVHTEEGWIAPLLESVKGVDAEVAAWKPAPQIASIWEIVAHATGWIEDLLADLTGSNGVDMTDWPPVNDASAAAWDETVSRLEERINSLERALKSLTLEEIYSPPPRERKRRSERLANIFVHNAYHSGQIVKMRQLHGALAAKTVAVVA